MMTNYDILVMSLSF